MDKITITIDGQKVTVPKTYTVLHAAEEIGIQIPRLCFLKDINETSACRLCVVNVKDMRGLSNSCTLAVREGMEIETDSQDIHDSVVSNLQLLASNHVFECWACERENNCELLDLMRRYNVDNVYGESVNYSKKDRRVNDTSTSIVLDSGKCILCGRCVTACEKSTGLGILAFNERGNGTYVGPANFHSMADSGCIYCGKCVEVCPTAAIKEKSNIDQVLDALHDKNKKVIVTMDSSVAVTLGEDFGSNIGENVEGKVYTSLQKLGFDEIVDINFAQNISLIELGTDLITRIKTGDNLPLYTSYSPGWINYIEQYEPEMIQNISSAKSPQQIAGNITKHYYAEKLGYQKEDVIFVSISSRIDKKEEADRKEMKFNGLRDVDYVLTTREYARMLKRKSIDFMKLQDGTPFGELATITKTPHYLDTSNSVLEATLFTISDLLDEVHTELDFKEVRGSKGFKEATYSVAGKDINVAIVHDGSTIQEFFNRMKKTKKDYHFVEYVAADGRFAIGGGQPIQPAIIQDSVAIEDIREKALFTLLQEQGEPLAPLKSNVMALYTDFFKEPGSKLAKKALHTMYKAEEFYK